MQILTGTSGFSYPAWRGSFYPEKLPEAKMLGYYAERLAAGIETMLDDAELRNRLVRNARQKVESAFSFAHRTRTIEAIYRRLVTT